MIMSAAMQQTFGHQKEPEQRDEQRCERTATFGTEHAQI